ncbi:MAG: UvrB/UvrC motif-containing protein, partial [Candidatus Hodarchaeales archaeon]
KNKTVASCLRRKTKQCLRPCEIDIDHEVYSKQISNFIKFFSGELPEVIIDLEKQMKRHVDELQFEKAALIRDDITKIKQHIKFKKS